MRLPPRVLVPTHSLGTHAALVSAEATSSVNLPGVEARELRVAVEPSCANIPSLVALALALVKLALRAPRAVDENLVRAVAVVTD
jgi:hypothetical protein